MTFPTLVLLPGMDGTATLFQPFQKALPPEAVTRSVSYPSDRIASYSELQGYLRSGLDLDSPYVIVAESFSGPLAIEHAAGRPPNLCGLVLVASFGANPLPVPLRWLGLFAYRIGSRFRVPAWLVRFLLLGRESPGELVDMTCRAIRSVRREVLADRIRQVLRVNAAPLLRSISVPVLCVGGSHDRLVGQRSLAQIKLGAPHVSSVILDGPHMLLQARPQEAVDKILEFLGSIGAR
ncbi:MAG: alpha/beta hydrolase [Planctomycetota bacterium]